MGTFAFGRDTRRRVISALANLRNFQGNERSALSDGLVGLNGPCRRLTSSRYGALPSEYAVGLDEAEYVVYCYGTPIAWVSNADGARFEGDVPRVNYVPDWQYSATTTYYQGLVMDAWGGKCVDPNPRKSRRDNRGSARGRSSDARYGRRGQEPTAAEVARAARLSPSGVIAHTRRAEGRTAPSGPPERFRTNHRGVRYDSTVERDTSYERDIAEARASERVSQRDYLLDPRLMDPEWTPWRDNGSMSSLPRGAEDRDFERVEAERRQGRGEVR